jgi:hypothetical protein
MHGRAEGDGAGASGREEQERRRDPIAQVSAAQGGATAAAVAAVPPPRRSATVRTAAPLQNEATAAARHDDRFLPVVHCCEPSRAAVTLGASCPSAPAAGG